ncbi:unnamed protein product [Caenorhabditis bovis]|uniref:G-protein coupled receptors family 1 profile domain-containing protein n=1 Tax=Caenorhabditis bovis TaxID=2654633 RepID=A0A8S1EWB9_9PELO|nr:unnamed protein product [Caenorhabditis bovis]
MNSSSIEEAELCSSEDEGADYRRIETIFHSINYALPLCAIAALASNINLLICIRRGIRQKRLPIKRYVMTIHRCVSDVVTLLVGFAYSANEYMNNCDNDHICIQSNSSWFSSLLQAIFILNYWSVALSYAGIAILTYIAVKSPLQYKVHLRCSVVLKTLGISWIAMILSFVSCIWLFHDGKLNYHANMVVHLFLDDFDKNEHVAIWLVDLCVNIDLQSPYRSALVTLAPPLFFYVVSLVAYCIISVELFNKRTTNAIKRHKSAMWRLGTHLVFFSITCFLTGFAYYGSLPMEQFCTSQKLNLNACLEPVVFYTRSTALAVFGWFMRMFFDGLIDVYVDGVLRRRPTKVIAPSMFSLTTNEVR